MILPEASFSIAITCGEWRCIKNPNTMTATIWAYAGEKQEGKVKCPAVIDGYPVDAIVISNLPGKLQIAYDPATDLLDYDK